LRWSNPELIVVPDEGDPWDQQFYYLSQHRMRDLRIGFLGHYRVVDQTMDVELIYSHDGRRWKRPMRGAWLPRGPQGSLDSMMIYMPTSLIDRGESWIGLYSAADVGHNGAGPSGREGMRTIHGIRIPRHRFAGMHTVASLTGRLRTRIFNPTGTKLLLDASIDGALRAELCDAFGRPLDGFRFSESVPVQGDSAAHELRWQTGDAADYIYDPVVLNLEWTSGTVYGVASAGN